MDPPVEFPRGMIRIMKRGNVVEDAGTIPDVPMRPPGPPLDPSRVTRAELEQVPRGVLRINAASFAPNANLELPRTSNIRYSRPRSPPRFRAPANSHLAPRGRTLAPVGVPPLRYRPIEQPRSIRLATNVSRPVQPVITRPSKSAVGSDIKSAPVFASDFATQEIFKALEQAKPTTIPKPPIPDLTDEEKKDPNALREYYLCQLRMLLKDSRILQNFTMSKSVKLIDSYFFWCMKKGPPLDHLVAGVDPKNTTFCVVGTVGLQDTGKSFILSQIVGPSSAAGVPVFDSQTTVNSPAGKFRTEGVDCFISRCQRTIFLDAQPVFSGSVLEEMIIGDRKPPAVSTEHVFVEHTVELQSIMFIAFLMSTCHKLLIVMKGCVDERVLRFLRAATILKLGPVHKDAHTEGNLHDHWPELIFVNNLCKAEDLYPERINITKQKVSALMKDYPLHYNSTLEAPSADDLKIFMVPDARQIGEDEYLMLQYQHQLRMLKEDVAGSLPRESVTPGVRMTEKDWFRYAKRCWAAVCKAPLVNTVAKELNVSNSVT